MDTTLSSPSKPCPPGPGYRLLAKRIAALEEAVRLAVDLVPPAMRHTQAGAELTAALERAGVDVRL